MQVTWVGVIYTISLVLNGLLNVAKNISIFNSCDSNFSAITGSPGTGVSQVSYF